jgi:superfamily II DNA or RNA helicase
MLQLKPRQEAAYHASVEAEAQGITRQLVVAPCAFGKTAVAARRSRDFHKTLFLVNRAELVEQTVASYQRFYPEVEVGVYWGQRTELEAEVVVATIQTIYSRLGSIDPELFDFVVADEAHIFGAPTHREGLDYFRPRLRYGTTATAERYDGASLSNLFDEIIYEMTIKEAIDEGYLVKVLGLRAGTHTDLTKVACRGGDFAVEELARTVNTEARNRALLEAWLTHGRDRKAIAFGADVQHAQDIAALAQSAYGLRAACIWDDDPDRAAKQAAHRRGELDLLTNVEILTIGYDDPTIQAVLVAAPTRSRVRYVQRVGRGLRLCPSIGKTDCLIIEGADTSRHTLCNVWDFFGLLIKDEATDQVLDLEAAVAEQATKLDRAKTIFHRQFGAPLNVKYFTEIVDLLAPPPTPPADPDYGRYAWHYDSPTPRQLAILAEAGYDVSQDWTKGQASNVINHLPATNNQLQALLAGGFDVITHPWTRAEADIALEGVDLGQADWRKLDRLIDTTTLKPKDLPTLEACLLGEQSFRCGHRLYTVVPALPEHRQALGLLDCPLCVARRHGVQLPRFRGSSAKQIQYGRTIYLRKLGTLPPSDLSRQLAAIPYASWWIDHSRVRKFTPQHLANYDPGLEDFKCRWEEPEPELRRTLY